MTNKEYKAWQHSKKVGSKKGGYDRDWQQVRRYILARDNYLCKLNMTPECRPDAPRPAVEVDHLVSHTQRPDLRLDPRNLRAACLHCNRAKVHDDKRNPAKVKALSDSMPPIPIKF